MTHHLYPLSDERSYFFDSLYDHNRLCHGSKTFFRQPNKNPVKLESMFTIKQVLHTSAVGNAWCVGLLCVLCVFICPCQMLISIFSEYCEHHLYITSMSKLEHSTHAPCQGRGL